MANDSGAAKLYILNGHDFKYNPFTVTIKTSNLDRIDPLIDLLLEKSAWYSSQKPSEGSYEELQQFYTELRDSLHKAEIPVIIKTGCFCPSPHRIDKDDFEEAKENMYTISTTGSDEYVMFSSCLQG